MKAFLEMVLTFCLGLLAVIVIAFIPTLLIYLLWNALLPTLFSLPIITYWQAYGLYLLSYLLFGCRTSTSSSNHD